MVIIPKIPPKSKVTLFVYAVPVSVRIILVIVLLAMAWHFRYSHIGVPVSEITKIPGVLHAVHCRQSRRGSDTIAMYTSLRDEPVYLDDWQKCININEVLQNPPVDLEVIFYTYRRKGILSSTAEGNLHIVAVDAVEPAQKKYIYPAHELGVRNEINIFGFLFLLSALILIFSLYAQWQEQEDDRQRSGS